VGSLKSSFTAVGLVLVTCGVALLASAAGAGGQTTAPPVSALSWTNANAAAGSGSNELKSISCTSANFCVAVGEQNSGAGFGALIEQWNGATWTVISNPASATHGAELNSVSCVGPNFCIAVGTGTTPFLAERWDGSSWSEATTGMSVPSGATAPTLYSVSCVSSTVCETLGTYFGQPGNVTTVTAFQWNATSWTNEAAATPSGSGSPSVTEATGMDCVSPTWCLAVGNVDAQSEGTPFSEVWNGSAWVLQSTPAPPGVGSHLSSVSCAGTSYCKAVGGTFLSPTSDDQNLIETWNGSAWSIDQSLPNDSPNGLTGVDCFSATSCTAVGTSSAGSIPASLVLNWNASAAAGTALWTIAPATPNQGSLSTKLSSVSCVTDWACVAAGDYGTAPGSFSAFAMSAPIARSGYRFVASDGGVFAYGPGAPFYGSTGNLVLNRPVVGMGVMPAGDGYDLVASDGGVFSYGSAKFFGSTGSITLNKPVVGMAVTPDGAGYWLVASDGGIFSYGDASFYGSTGSMTLNKPIVGMASTPDGKGYWLVASDGGIFSYGDASFYGSTGSIALNKPVVGMAASLGKGYYLVASDGGIFSFPDASAGGPPFFGSTGSISLNKPIVGMTTVTGGYYLAGSDGGVFAFPGGASNVPPFLGSTGSITLNKPVVGIAS
jgi:hypothetical protein